jgi:ferredoxin
MRGFFMADITKKIPLNAIGKYYVDQGCICCGICTTFAASVFIINLDEEFGYVGKQPQTEEEVKAVIEAMNNCPVDAIGDDGDETI